MSDFFLFKEEKRTGTSCSTQFQHYEKGYNGKFTMYIYIFDINLKHVLSFQKQSGWIKKTLKDAVSGSLDLPMDENNMDYWGGDLPEPC